MRPCPFCGRTDGFQVKTVWKTYRFVACRCKAAGPVMGDDEAAVEAWNTRRDPPRGTCRVIDGKCSCCGWGDATTQWQYYSCCPHCGRTREDR